MDLKCQLQNIARDNFTWNCSGDEEQKARRASTLLNTPSTRLVHEYACCLRGDDPGTADMTRYLIIQEVRARFPLTIGLEVQESER